MDLFEKCYQPMIADEVRAANLYPYFHEITTRQHSEVVMDGRRTIMLGSNNYLGLTSDDRVIKAAKEAIEKYGSGCSGSRFLNGTLSIHIELEEKLAEFLKKEAVVTFSTGFQSNLGIITALCQRKDNIYFDRANHASLFDAARLSYGKLVKYKHNNMEELEEALKRCPEDKGRLIVVDGVFSMEGDLADLPNIAKIASKYGARIMIDDSHGVGVMGAHGRGTGEHFALEDKVDVLMGTFSKSFASLGGYMAGDARVIDYVRHVSRPFIFSASMPPANVAAVIEALRILKAEPERVKAVNDNADYMRKGFKQLGIPIGDSMAPIIPVSTYFNERTLIMTRALLENGVYINPVVHPAVPEGEDILRTSYIATHTKEQLDFALDKFDKVFNKLYPLSSDEIKEIKAKKDQKEELNDDE